MKNLEIILPDEFRCSNCGLLPIVEFTAGHVISRLKSGNSGGMCKKCKSKSYQKHFEKNKQKKSEYNKSNYIQNKENVLKRNKLRYETKKEEILEQAKKRYENNKEKYLEKGKEYRLNNKMKIKIKNEKYRKNNPDKVAQTVRNSIAKKPEHYKKVREQWRKDNGLQLKSKRIWNGTNAEYNLDDFLNNKGVVYFIGDTNGIYVKIGITSNIFSLSHRFRSIQGCNPVPLKLLGFIQTNNARKLEKQLHQQFKTHNRIGEWHILAPEINRYIKENCMHIELANTMIGETYLSLPSLLADDMGY